MSPVQVDLILKEMAKTKGQVAHEIIKDHDVPLILREDSEYSLEELIEELEEESGLEFNI